MLQEPEPAGPAAGALVDIHARHGDAETLLARLGVSGEDVYGGAIASASAAGKPLATSGSYYVPLDLRFGTAPAFLHFIGPGHWLLWTRTSSKFEKPNKAKTKVLSTIFDLTARQLSGVIAGSTLSAAQPLRVSEHGQLAVAALRAAHASEVVNLFATAAACAERAYK